MKSCCFLPFFGESIPILHNSDVHSFTGCRRELASVDGDLHGSSAGRTSREAEPAAGLWPATWTTLDGTGEIEQLVSNFTNYRI